MSYYHCDGMSGFPCPFLLPRLLRCQPMPLPRRTSDAGVAPDRQKIMVKGGMLKDDADWAKLGIKPGQKLMMMGSAGAQYRPWPVTRTQTTWTPAHDCRLPCSPTQHPCTSNRLLCLMPCHPGHGLRCHGACSKQAASRHLATAVLTRPAERWVTVPTLARRRGAGAAHSRA